MLLAYFRTSLAQILTLSFVILFLNACPSTRVPVPTGDIPSQQKVLNEDEQYGHEVFSHLSQRFQIDRNDDRIFRVRGIVEKLTAVRNNNKNIWHVHVFDDDNFINAAATRGNYIFVWSGLMNTVEDDAELATILAHEIGHVLAGHTKPDPAEEVNEMLADLTGQTTRQIMISSGSGTVIGLASLGGLLAAELLRALIINPDRHSLELAADELGLFIMAEAGYDPQKAVDFWRRMKDNPAFGNSPAQFLSTHPSSEERLEALQELLPRAMARYRGEAEPPIVIVKEKAETKEIVQEQKPVKEVKEVKPIEKPFTIESTRTPYRVEKTRQWKVMDEGTAIFSEPDKFSKTLRVLEEGAIIEIEHREGRWLKVSTPTTGYVESLHLSPIE